MRSRVNGTPAVELGTPGDTRAGPNALAMAG